MGLEEELDLEEARVGTLADSVDCLAAVDFLGEMVEETEEAVVDLARALAEVLEGLEERLGGEGWEVAKTVVVVCFLS